MAERGDGGQMAIGADERGFDAVLGIRFLLPTISREFHRVCSKGQGEGMDFEIKQPYSVTCQPYS